MKDSKVLDKWQRYATAHRDRFQLRFDDERVKYVVVYPAYVRIMRKTADALIETMGLKHIPGYNVFPCTGVGGYVYVTSEYKL